VVLRPGADGPEVLLIRRRDIGRHALPGGYQDPSDPGAHAAALQELAEETGLRPDAPHTRTIGTLIPSGSHAMMTSTTTIKAGLAIGEGSVPAADTGGSEEVCMWTDIRLVSGDLVTAGSQAQDLAEQGADDARGSRRRHRSTRTRAPCRGPQRCSRAATGSGKE
jgi:ADP-ribose pyrophosphatase YjhB (NUDIX family)